MVEIKINTTTDSKEDIKRAVEFLHKYLESTNYNIDDAPAPLNIFEKNVKEDEEDDSSNKELNIKPIFY